MSLIAVVTGANRGIGLELARILVTKYNAKVIACFRNVKENEKSAALKAIDSSMALVELDVADANSIKQCVEKIKSLTTHVDVLMNNAGVLAMESNLEDVTEATLLDSFRINTFGPTLFLQSMLPLLLAAKAPVNVFTTSLMGSIDDNGSGGMYSYRASKCAINMINKSVSIDYPGLISMTIHPGFVQTGMTKKYWENGKPEYMITPEVAADGMLSLVFSNKKENSGKYFNYDGEVLPW